MADKSIKLKRKRSYYSKSKTNAGSNGFLRQGITGFLLTCNGREYECVRESYQLLNETYDEVYGTNTCANKGVDDVVVDVVDVESALNQELNTYKTSGKRFQQVITKCNNVLFIKCNDQSIDPFLIINQLLKRIETNAKQFTRYLLRILPIVVTCKPNDDNFDKQIESLVSSNVNEETTYMIHCKVRNNSDIKRTQLIDSIVNIIKKVKPKWTVNFDSPKLTLIADIVHKTCCITIVNDYNYYCKYNLIEFAKKVITNKNKN